MKAKARTEMWDSIGDAAVSGMTKYYQQKQEEQQLMAESKRIIEMNPDLAKSISPEILESFAKGKPKRDDILSTYSSLNMGLKMKEQQQAQKTREVQEFVAVQEANARAMAAMAERKAANSKNLGAMFMSNDQQRDMARQGIDVTGRPVPGGLLATSQSGMSQPTRMYRSPEEEATAAASSAEAKAEAEAAIKFVERISADALSASESEFKLTELRGLLESPDTQTGAGQEYLTGVRGFLSRAGFKDEALKDQQAMETLLAEDSLNQTIRLLNGQGSVSDNERKEVKNTALAARKDKGALIRILGMREAAAARTQAAEAHRIMLEDSGMGARDQKKELTRWFKSNPFSAFVPAYGGYDASAANSILVKKPTKK
jgi:hypothetical protein